MTDFATFEERKRQLQDHLDRLMGLLRQGELVPDPEKDLRLLQGFRDGLAGDLLFRVLCVGDFSTGKSSFINRFLLEQDLLPAWPRPTTTLLTRIRHGEHLKAIRYRPSTQKGMDLKAEEVTKDIPGTLKDWVSTAGKGVHTDSISPVIMEAPAPRLAAGFEIIDAPGLNDPNLERMRLTLDYLNQADGVLFFVNATQLWTKYQKTFFEGEILTRSLLDRLYIVVNYWDQIEPSQRGEALEYIEQQVRASLAKGTTTPAADLRIPILPVSSKTGENAELLQQIWDTLGTRKFSDVLSLRVERFNKELDKYSGILAARLDMLALDPQGRSRRRAQLQQEVKDYEQQREAFLAGLKRLLELEFIAYCQGLRGLFQ
jgi:GTPase SAR1 family protein